MYVIYGHILNLGRNLDVVSLYLIWDRYILSASVNFSASRSHSLLIMKWWSSLNTSFHIMQHISKGKHLLMLNTSIKLYKPKVKENRGDIICPHQQVHQCRGRNKACFSQLTGQCPHCSEHRASLKVFQHNVQCSRTWIWRKSLAWRKSVLFTAMANEWKNKGNTGRATLTLSLYSYSHPQPLQLYSLWEDWNRLPSNICKSALYTTQAVMQSLWGWDLPISNSVPSVRKLPEAGMCSLSLVWFLWLDYTWPAIKMLVAGTHITGTAVSWAQ